MDTGTIQTSQLMTVRQFSEKHKAFPQSSLRHLIFYSHKNGFNKVIVRIGRRILLDEHMFFEWIDSKRKV
ncbi:MAG: hypothetical protein R3D88_04810 [Alphaproteobacteria bacterium]